MLEDAWDFAADPKHAAFLLGLWALANAVIRLHLWMLRRAYGRAAHPEPSLWRSYNRWKIPHTKGAVVKSINVRQNAKTMAIISSAMVLLEGILRFLH